MAILVGWEAGWRPARQSQRRQVKRVLRAADRDCTACDGCTVDAPYAGARTQSHRCSNPPPAFWHQTGLPKPTAGKCKRGQTNHTPHCLSGRKHFMCAYSSRRFPRRRLDSRFPPRGRRVVRQSATMPECSLRPERFNGQRRFGSS